MANGTRVITSRDDEWSPEITQHRQEAYSNGYEDALDELRASLEAASKDSRLAHAPAERIDGLQHALSLLTTLEETLP